MPSADGPAHGHHAPGYVEGQAAVTSAEEAAGRLFVRRSYSTPASLAGLPALSVPCGFSASGLPIGLQLVGRPFDEPTLFRLASAREAATDWHHRRPPLAC